VTHLNERADEALYLTEGGTRYRVHDACFGPPLAQPGRYKVVPLGSPQANTRYFVDAIKVVRAYPFKRNESRTITEAALLQQLHGSGFVGQTAKHEGARRP
jgi:hypothetical protein